MPLGSTGRRGRKGALAGLLLVLLLAGCSQGQVSDERTFEMQEAKKTQVVPGAQETMLATEFDAPDASPFPTLTPAPGLDELTIALDVTASGAPGQRTEVVASLDGTIYASARLTSLRAGQVVAVRWVAADGAEIGSGEQSASAGGDQWVSIPFALPPGTAPGKYAAIVSVDDRRLGSIVFEVQ